MYSYSGKELFNLIVRQRPVNEFLFIIRKFQRPSGTLASFRQHRVSFLLLDEARESGFVLTISKGTWAATAFECVSQ